MTSPDSPHSRLNPLLRKYLRPDVVLLVMALVSLLAWLIPGTSAELRGFGERVNPTWGGVLVLSGYYLVAAAVAAAGVWLGRRLPRPAWLDGVVRGESREADVDDRMTYILTCAAAVGVGYLVVAAGGPMAFLDAMVHTNANVLKEATGGAPGLATLRYATIVAAPISLHRAISRKRGYTLAVVNLALLAVSAIVASRLSIMMATLVFIVLVVRRPLAHVARSLVWWIVGGLVIIGGALVFLNYVRNGGYYAEQGVSDPFIATVFQVLAYVGSPTQVAMGVANGLAADPSVFTKSISDGARVLIPSVFTDDVPGRVAGSARYHYLADIHFTLTTNSAFADTVVDYGIAGLLFALIWVLVWAVAFALFMRCRTYAAAAAGASLYCFAEFWRLLLMNQGIAIFVVLAVAGSCVAAALSIHVRSLDTLLRRAGSGVHLASARRAEGDLPLE